MCYPGKEQVQEEGTPGRESLSMFEDWVRKCRALKAIGIFGRLL